MTYVILGKETFIDSCLIENKNLFQICYFLIILHELFAFRFFSLGLLLNDEPFQSFYPVSLQQPGQ